MSRRPSRGVTLVEVLMAIAIMALLTGLAAPSFVESVARSRLEGTVATLANDLQYARSESLRRRSLRAKALCARSAVSSNSPT